MQRNQKNNEAKKEETKETEKMKWNILLFDEIISMFSKADESEKVTAAELIEAGLIER